MEYINTSSIRKLIRINNIARLVNPGEKVELSQNDIDALGIYDEFFKSVNPVPEIKKKKTSKKRKKV